MNAQVMVSIITTATMRLLKILPQTENCTEDEWQGWNAQNTLLLISQYAKLKSHFEDRCQKKKNVWRKLAEAFRAHNIIKSAEELEEKFKGLKRTYTKHKRNKQSIGRGRKQWAFFQAMDEVLGSTAVYTAPVVTSGTGGGRRFGGQEARIELHPTPESSIIPSASLPTEPQPLQTQTEQAGNTATGPPPNLRKKRPATLLSEILETVREWQNEDRKRYKQLLKMQRQKLRLLTELVRTSRVDEGH